MVWLTICNPCATIRSRWLFQLSRFSTSLWNEYTRHFSFRLIPSRAWLVLWKHTSQEHRGMSYHRRYKLKDDRFGLMALTLREKAGLAQTEVASVLGVSERTIRHWEGGTAFPTADNL